METLKCRMLYAFLCFHLKAKISFDTRDDSKQYRRRFLIFNIRYQTHKCIVRGMTVASGMYFDEK